MPAFLIMVKDIEVLLDKWPLVLKRDPKTIDELSEYYLKVTSNNIDFKCKGCIPKAFFALKKYCYQNTNTMSKEKKEYVLKPGNHQFVPGSPHKYNNGNLSDEEAVWWIEKNPHLQSLFEKKPKKQKDKPSE